MSTLFDEDIEETGWRAEWVGMPTWTGRDSTFYREIMVQLRTKEDFDLLSSRLGDILTEKTTSVYYPKAERRDYVERMCYTGKSK
jgi:hypothetical protein